MVIPSNRWIWNLNPDIRWNRLPKNSFQTKKRETTQLLYIQMHANQASAITKTGHNNSPDHASTSSTVLQIWHSPWLATKQAMANCGVHQNSRCRIFHCVFFDGSSGHVSCVPSPERASPCFKKDGWDGKNNKNQTIYSFTLKYLEVYKETHSNILQNFKKSCLSFNFPLFKHLKKPSLHFAARPFFVPLPSCFDVHNSFSHTAHSGDPLARVQAHKGLGLGNFSGWCGLMLGWRTSYCKYSVTLYRRINAHNICIQIITYI